MPKISAATVVDHRAAQRRALLDAARTILAETPEKRPSLGQVAARAGLARSSVYNYFTSREDLLNAVVEDMFPRWTQKVAEAMDLAEVGVGQVLANVDANLTLVAEGEHAIVSALAAFSPQSFRDSRIMAMHDQLVLPLVGALRAGTRRSVACWPSRRTMMVLTVTTCPDSPMATRCGPVSPSA